MHFVHTSSPTLPATYPLFPFTTEKVKDWKCTPLRIRKTPQDLARCQELKGKKNQSTIFRTVLESSIKAPANIIPTRR